MSSTYEKFQDRVQAARVDRQALNIVGSDSKKFYGEAPQGVPLDMRDNQGIIEYDPAELVIVARTGTPLADIQAALAEQGQMLGFEPPFADRGATLGGAVASGLNGSARAYKGAVRDYLLGIRLINGKAEVLQFGGKVMKNVAGFDLFRPMAGAMGTLGPLLEVSLRLVPVPEREVSFTFVAEDRAVAITILCKLGQELACLSAAAWYQGEIWLRLSGSALAIQRDRELLAAKHALNDTTSDLWSSLATFEHPFFSAGPKAHLRVVIDLPPAAADIELPGEQLIDWGGARRYLSTPMALETVRAAVQPLGGFAHPVQRDQDHGYFHPLSPGLMVVHRRLKAAFDAEGIFNPGRLYPQL